MFIFFGKPRINLCISLCSRAKHVFLFLTILSCTFQAPRGNIISQKWNVQLLWSYSRSLFPDDIKVNNWNSNKKYKRKAYLLLSKSTIFWWLEKVNEKILELIPYLTKKFTTFYNPKHRSSKLFKPNVTNLRSY